MRDFASKARCRCSPWTTSWPVTSGLRTPSSSTGRNPSRITWLHPTSCCGWRMTGLCSTPWGNLKSHFGPQPGKKNKRLFSTSGAQRCCVIQLEVEGWLKHPSGCNNFFWYRFLRPLLHSRSPHTRTTHVSVVHWCVIMLSRTVNWRSEELRVFAVTLRSVTGNWMLHSSSVLHHRNLCFDRKTAKPTLLVIALTLTVIVSCVVARI